MQVFCSIHPRMNAVVVVLQNPFFAKPARDGHFSLAGVPAGTHRQALPARGAAPAKAVTVPATGSVDVQFQ